jgi:hypothetical protein
MTDRPIPARQPLIVVSADEPRPRTLGWTVREYIGSEITRPNSEEPLLLESDIKEGDTIWVQGLWGTCEMVVQQGCRSALASQTLAILEFDQDDRHCWVSAGMVNTRGLKRTDLTRDDE